MYDNSLETTVDILGCSEFPIVVNYEYNYLDCYIDDFEIRTDRKNKTYKGLNRRLTDRVIGRIMDEIHEAQSND